MTQFKSLTVSVAIIVLVLTGLHAVMQSEFGWHPQGLLNLIINVATAVVITAWRK
jgi:hypothetical protein